MGNKNGLNTKTKEGQNVGSVANRANEQVLGLATAQYFGQSNCLIQKITFCLWTRDKRSI